MANTRISNLTASASNLASTDLAPVVQTAGVGPVKMTGLQLAGGLLGSTTFNGSTVVTSSPVLNLTQTWNDGAGGTVTFTGLRFNATDTASASGSLLLDLQVGGTSVANITKSAVMTLAGASGRLYVDAIQAATSGTQYFDATTFLFRGTTFVIETGQLRYATDLFLRRAAAATLQLGAADAAAPVAQTFKVQSVVAGTTNTAGANFTIQGSQGTGTGAGGSIIFQVAPAGSSGTAQNAYSTALTIASDQTATLVGNLTTPRVVAVNGLQFGAGNDGYILGGNGFASFYVSSTYNLYVRNASTSISVDGSWKFGFTNGAANAAPDTVLVRDGAPNTLALRNGTNAQTFRVYNTYNGTNDEWGTFDFSSVSNHLTIGTLKSGSGISRSIRLVVGGTRVAISDGSFLQVDVDLYPTQNVIMAAKYTEMSEMTAPTAPAANKVRIYAEDNGSGKTRLMALFNTGAAQQIAIEP